MPPSAGFALRKGTKKQKQSASSAEENPEQVFGAVAEELQQLREFRRQLLTPIRVSGEIYDLQQAEQKRELARRLWLGDF